MREIVVHFRERKIFSLALDKIEFTIGRSEKCDLILTGDNVSRCHAILKLAEDGVWLHDESRHGTELNNNKITDATRISHKDQIQISEWRLEFHDLANQKPHHPHQAKDITRSSHAHESTKLIRFDQTDHRVKIFKPMLLITDPAGRLSHKSFRKDVLTVGTAPDCDICIIDEYASRHHARFSITHRGLLCEDLDSTNGTWSCGARVVEKILKDGDTVLVGRTSIHASLTEEGSPAKDPVNSRLSFDFVGEHPLMKNLMSRIETAAGGNLPIFVQGESGTGKELVAKAVHELSTRSQQPLVVINCAAISPALVESELFGHERGAFTGAEIRHAGVFEQAHGGTLFLDEVGELSLEVQAKLLRVLESGLIRRVGGETDIPVDVRLISATHKNLGKMVAKNEFRLDLFYRIFVIGLTLPTLKERREDIPLLVNCILKSRPETANISVSHEAMLSLTRHPWPGNVRELKNVILRAVCFCHNHTLYESDIEFLSVMRQNVGSSRQRLLLSKEARTIQETLLATGGNKEAAADQLKMGRSTLFRKLKEFKIEGLVS